MLTLCLDTLNNVISDNEGLRPNQSFCYWTSTGDYSSCSFDIGRHQMAPARASSGFSFPPSRVKVIRSHDGNVLEIEESKAIFAGTS